MPEEEKEEDEEFQYIVRMKNTDLDGSKPVTYALKDIKGVGTRVAEMVMNSTGIDPNEKIGKLGDETIEEIKEAVDNFSEEAPSWAVNRQKDPVTGEYDHVLKNELDTVLREDINRMQKISCYKGIRHERGQKVRGQRTKSNGRTGMELGVEKKLARAQAESEAEEEA
ncbi:MAG: 30S ribosomal protein S13 [Candidatus Thermoplasmatota archaeon]